VLAYRSGAGNAVTLSSKESLILIPTKAGQTDAAVPDAAVAQVTPVTQALTPVVGSAAGKALELSDGSPRSSRGLSG